MFLLASCAALRSSLVLSLHSGCVSVEAVTVPVSSPVQVLTTVSTAMALTISPCASPPMPSETTYRFSGCTMRKQSSLLARCCPTSLCPPLTMRTNPLYRMVAPTLGHDVHPGRCWDQQPHFSR